MRPRAAIPVLFVVILASGGFAQTPAPVPAAADPAAAQAAAAQAELAREQAELSQAIGEAGGTSIEIIRALEQHLKKYPESLQRAEIEKAIVKSAMDANDTARIIVYGEKVLARETPPDAGGDITTVLDRVTRALLDKEDAPRAKRAIVYSKRYQADVADMRAKMQPPGHLTAAQWSEELDKAAARALALEARATGYAGDSENAAKLARKSWDAYPTGEGARETAFWLSKLGRNADAIEFYADAFTLEDARNTETDRARDRARLGSLYIELHGSEKGLGEIILQAYDRTAGLLAALRANLKAKDPNSAATSLADFSLPAIDKSAAPLVLAALKGKTVVMDFWATWCAPCRAQQPLIEKVKQQFENASDVVFVPVDADDDPSLVPSFVKEQGWENKGYFEAGLARQLAIGSIPTVVVLDPDGRIFSRLVGFIPERFEQMLVERVEEARKTSVAK
jgi:thiol-disulfide isomerase/thioredoxin